MRWIFSEHYWEAIVLQAEYILDERSYVEEMINDNNLGRKPSHTLLLAGRLWRQQGYNNEEIRHMLEDFIIRSDPHASIVKWANTISWTIKILGKRDLVKLDYVPITNLEIGICSTVGMIQKQRLMFTLFALAKFNKLTNPKNEGWVSITDARLFSLANIQMGVKKQSLMLNDLYQNKYISFARGIDNTSIKVLFLDMESPAVLRLTDMRNLGNQYMLHTQKGYMQCECCGKIVKKNSNNQRYCKPCARIMNIENNGRRRKQLIQNLERGAVAAEV